MAQHTIESLTAELESLKDIVERQRVLLSKTGEQLLQLQVKLAQKDMKEIPNPATAISGTQVDTADFATNEDLVQLVGELQGQLTLLDDKSLIRTQNSHSIEDTDLLNPLPNLDGTLPEFFPKNVAEFKALGDDDIVQLGRFYELVPLTVEEEAKWELYLNGESKSPELGEDEQLIGSEGVDESVVLKLWDQLAAFLGISHLKRDI